MTEPLDLPESSRVLESVNTSQIFRARWRAASFLGTLIPKPGVSISDEEFLERFAKLEVVLNELFALEEEGLPDHEWRRHSEEHNRLLSLLLDVYGDPMQNKKKSASDIYLILKAELAAHVRHYDSPVIGK